MRGRNWELQPLYQLQLLLCEKGMLWRTDVASPAAPSAQGSVLSPLKGERDSLPGASGRNASAYLFGRKRQGHKSKTQISSDCLMCSQKSKSVAWLTVPLCPVLAALQRVWPAHCPCSLSRRIPASLSSSSCLASFRALAHVCSSTYTLHCPSFSWVILRWTVELVWAQSGHLNVAEGESGR